MKVEIVETKNITTYVGIRATAYFSNLGESINHAFIELTRRKDEILNIKNLNVTYGITPPNYKGNTGLVDFYCCYEVEPIFNVPQGMVHIHLLPRTYTLTHYVGPASQTGTAYDYTSNWMNENGYTYDDVAYYFERYDEKTIIKDDNEKNETKIYCPVKKI
ncbi:GyrI-like domain-containing protein [Paenibacillus sp. KQZ6P-2]|uniref:GyrI-like domain-containing protein n=1 Tax=Paenibacillus mangrovi TaxID=2931978 RepID=A0A9X1WKQ9_9BACL|nr:GyrI-like domain-containing protein [Paenibacillus mangrovi]MCJ8010778.1 GyrI-like domain-containing protein [Paenibacillus mangrovi]